MTQPEDILREREQYFTDVNLLGYELNCGDDRSSELDVYVHTFGGVLFVPYTLLVMDQISNGKTTKNFQQLTNETIPMLVRMGVNHPGVHSDEASENALEFTDQNSGNSIGCGYVAKRTAISKLINEKTHEIISECAEMIPELFDDSGQEFAMQVCSAHKSLVQDSDAISSGREVVSTAKNLGCDVVIFRGAHTAVAGIVNTQKGSSFLTGKALANGNAAYDHDLWASNKMFDLLKQEFPYDDRELAIASLVDIVGTMKALGATDIAVR